MFSQNTNLFCNAEEQPVRSGHPGGDLKGFFRSLSRHRRDQNDKLVFGLHNHQNK